MRDALKTLVPSFANSYTGSLNCLYDGHGSRRFCTCSVLLRDGRIVGAMQNEEFCDSRFGSTAERFAPRHWRLPILQHRTTWQCSASIVDVSVNFATCRPHRLCTRVGILHWAAEWRHNAMARQLLRSRVRSCSRRATKSKKGHGELVSKPPRHNGVGESDGAAYRGRSSIRRCLLHTAGQAASFSISACGPGAPDLPDLEAWRFCRRFSRQDQRMTGKCVGQAGTVGWIRDDVLCFGLGLSQEINATCSVVPVVKIDADNVMTVFLKNLGYVTFATGRFSDGPVEVLHG